MASQAKHVQLAGSHRGPRGFAVIGPAQPDEHIEVTLRLRPRAGSRAKIRRKRPSRSAQGPPVSDPR